MTYNVCILTHTYPNSNIVPILACSNIGHAGDIDIFFVILLVQHIYSEMQFLFRTQYKGQIKV
jgi:hypothetical protein